MILFDRRLLEHGIRIGLACASGIVGEAKTLTAEQIAVMLETLAMDGSTVEAIARSAIEEGEKDRPPSVKEWRELVANLMVRASKPVLVKGGKP